MTSRRSGPRPSAVDPDLGPGVVARHSRNRQRHRTVLPVIALGGMAGAALRYLAEIGWPTPDGAVPWATWGVNVSGCLLIGVLMVFVTEVGGGYPLLRPFVGVGLLGGFTTFSTYTVEVNGLLLSGRPGWALGYLLGTVVTALLAVAAGVVLARGLDRARRRIIVRRGGQV